MGGAVQFRLRFPTSDIARWYGRYDQESDDAVLKSAAEARATGAFTRKQFLEVCAWKSPRNRTRHARNSAGYVRVVTAASLAAEDERFRIEVLTLLAGVNWPTASAILNLAFPNKYPILDFRALWSLGWKEPPAYGFEFWRAYMQYCRGLARRCGLTVRELDRALWQYSKERQQGLRSGHSLQRPARTN